MIAVRLELEEHPTGVVYRRHNGKNKRRFPSGMTNKTFGNDKEKRDIWDR